MNAENLSRKFAPSDDAISLLCSDHTRLAHLFETFDKMKGSKIDKARVVKLICIELKIHSLVEEKIFFPAACAAIRDPLVLDEIEVIHALATQLVSELADMTPDDPGFDAKVCLLGKHVHDHGEKERREIFPKVAKTGVDLHALGAMIRLRRQELLRLEQQRLARPVIADSGMAA